MKKSRIRKGRVLLRITLGIICFTLLANGFLFEPDAEAGNKAISEAKTGANKTGFTRSAARALQATDRGTIGEWSGVEEWEDIPVHISLLPNGKLLYWGRDKDDGDENDDDDVNDIELRCNAYLYDPLYKITTSVPNNRTNLFCSSHSFLPDGRLLIAGGHELARDTSQNPPPIRYEVESTGSKHINIFDYRIPYVPQVSTPWSAGPNMSESRWYPSQVMLNTGEVLITAGSYIEGWDRTQPIEAENLRTEIYQLTGSLRRVGDIPLEIDNYPFLTKTSDGKVVLTQRFGQTGFVYDPVGSRWLTQSEQPLQTTVIHGASSSAVFGDSRFMIIGGRLGNNCPTARVESIDINNVSEGYQELAPLNFRRNNHTAVTLPDGKVFVVGGSKCKGGNNFVSEGNEQCVAGIPAAPCTDGAAKTPELYNPASNQWTLMAEHQTPRAYHSTALLMPDGRVLVGGGGRPGAYGETSNSSGQPTRDAALAHKNVEYFSPPYLFTADGDPAIRPAITSAPSKIAYGQTFGVGVGDIPANQLGQVVLFRLPSVTHGINYDQRRVVLNFTANGEYGLNVTAPASAGDCPPGPYMMFVLNQNGTPSVAKILFVGDTSISRDSSTFPDRPKAGGDMIVSVLVTTRPGMLWNVTGLPNWVTIISGGSGSASGTVTLKISPHIDDPNIQSTLRPRKATINIANQPFTIYQGAKLEDIPTTHPFHDEISKMYARGITLGCTDVPPNQPASFCSDYLITRQEMAAFLIRSLGVEPPPGRPNPFSDVQMSSTFYKYIVDLYERGLTGGCSNDEVNQIRNFCPTNNLKRAEAAVFVERTMGLSKPQHITIPLFSDISTPQWAWAYDFINDIGRRGISLGCGGGKFCPESQITRGQMAVFLVRAFGW